MDWDEKAVKRYAAVMFTRHFPHWPPGQPKTLELPRDTASTTTSRRARRSIRSARRSTTTAARCRYAELKRAGRRARRLPAAALRRDARRPRAALHAEQPAVRHRLLRDPARRRGGGAGQPDEPHRGAAPLRRGLATRAWRSPAQDVLRADRAAARRRPRARASSPPTPTTSTRRPTCRCRTSCARRARRRARRRHAWSDALAREPAAAAAPGAGPTTSRVMPYTSGTTGKPKGCMHTHRSVQATTRGRTCTGAACRSDERRCSRVLPLFHVTGMQASMNAPIHVGAHDGAAVALGPRLRRRC